MALACGQDIRFTPRQQLLGWAKFLALSGLLVWALALGTGNLGYNWQWYRVPRFLFTRTEAGLVPGPLLDGLWVTVKITALAFVLAFAIGLATALMRLSSSILGRALARGYLELIRNTPLIIQIFFLYFVIAPILAIPAFHAAVLALALFEGAYASEIFRAGIVSIDRGQWEASLGTGLTRTQAYRFVILPQAVRRILPPLAGQAVSLVKDSALVSTIAIYDLTMRGQAIVAETFLTFEIWFTVACIYLALTLTLSLAIGRLQRRFQATC